MTCRQLASLLALGAFALTVPPAAQAQNADGDGSGFRLGFELKSHWRDSDAVRFPSPFPFELVPGFPAGRQVFLETVEPGSHLEVSVLTLFLDAAWGRSWSAKLKLDLVDRYDRNPTSEDNAFDVDEAWLRWGHEADPGELPDRRGAYLKLGKFPHFERQDDRHLESYGVVSTAFNRFEDAGLEVGADLGRRLYLKASYTQGNPLFFRDPNALAGDNGIADRDGNVTLDPELGSGLPIFYDADVEDLDFADPELGAGIGLRFGDAAGRAAVDLLVWRRERDLADGVDLKGTLYGGDLDLLGVPEVPVPGDFDLDVDGRRKRETGANLWLYAGGFSFFGQYVDAEAAGIPRTGYEAEVAWSFELPYLGSVGGRQVFPFLQPAVRFSRLEPEVTGGLQFPAPSVRWEWEKLDVGLRLGVIRGVLDLTAEWSRNEFVRSGRKEEADELLLTVRWRMSRGSTASSP